METENVWSVGLWNTLFLLTHFYFYITFQEITFGLLLLLLLFFCFSFKLKMLVDEKELYMEFGEDKL